jgi:predicted nucleic acid-binding protein
LIVVDANVVVALFLGSTYQSEARLLLERDDDWVAPLLWRSEFRNALTGLFRQGEIELEDARLIQTEAEDFMGAGEFGVDSNVVLDLVSRSECSAYDCEYVALAKQLGAQLVTADKKVLRTFPHVAVPLAAINQGGL